MKKIVLLLLSLTAFAFAAGADGEMNNSMIRSASVLAAGIGLGLAALGGAIGMGNTAAATISGTARNPGVASKLMTTMFVALAMVEAQVIYALVITLIVLYGNPMLG
ncbi:ATP synthase, F0 complex, c subunit [Campylobacter pinnipediorum subsp. caledonicus]|uniref:ATP synthase subunit c n=1 Tax=Campylobacter pinnipediorum subsp. caledonicus TaxID=1874362 RepID=A0A1S6U8Q6_9BACT|nr:F0F1 ATP synthase subunit C [Campylobacter pinnipediorum]AQW86413.1 ATP synthase, F0 complex, c subunit [Campylobacter pinnipediorum subsp. caledonicus]AQW88065.1 ATP synthase, F0 complex, c subunit [Campylobacter pinnipediorum subsp. caledonicus]OPA71509.1 ATP synthase F0 subunit C [Campylobacter pinnipediorum subsp. caledonicus]